MSTQSSKRPVRPRGRPRLEGLRPSVPGPVPQPSLPPVAEEAILSPSADDIAATMPSTPKRRNQTLRPDSKVRVTALRIVALRAAGMTEEEIANTLKIARSSVSGYVWKASKQGWLDESQFGSAKEAIEYGLMPKVLRNLHQGLEDENRHQTSQMMVKTSVALKIAEETVFKSFDQEVSAPVAQAMVAIRIEMPPGPPQKMREDTIGGTPAYVDAEVADDGHQR